MLDQVIVQSTPTAIKNSGWKFYLLFIISTAISIPFVYFLFPEVGPHTIWQLETNNDSETDSREDPGRD